MRAKTITNIPTYEELYNQAPPEIKEYIEKCKNIPQDPHWHKEGNVYVHNRLVYDRAREYGDLNLAIAAFFHDLGKVDKTAPNKKGSWSAINHEKVSKDLVKRYNVWIESLGADSEEVEEIVDQHMRIKQMDKMRPSKQEQMRKNPYFDKLNKFTEFDSMKTLTDEELNRYNKFK